MAVLYNGNTRNWNYNTPGVAKELLITITGCKMKRSNKTNIAFKALLKVVE
ncbi:hypothetical protein [Helicobacter bizzozeronii]|uniref:hypothetical protein n=1 Tax=Helicobacter bizzozeronii TaxID=56877 RepID=UPI0013154395|nr:hypothetical protein [Helicobacter bizzozeronii]